MKIWTLMENTTCREDLQCEHGLSLYIETGAHKILFDGGKTDLFSQNAQKMGVDLSAVDIAVLSHGHFDHSGGLSKFLELNDHAKIYANRLAAEAHYGTTGRYIGLAPELLESGRLRFVEDTLQLDAGITLFSCNDRPRRYPTDSLGFHVLRNGGMEVDDFCHEQYLLIEESGKRIVFSGCSHKGILNIVNWFQPDVLIGGFHFVNLDLMGQGRRRLCEAAEMLLDNSCVYYTGHCTGEAQYALLKEKMGARLHGLSTGCVFDTSFL